MYLQILELQSVLHDSESISITGMWKLKWTEGTADSFLSSCYSLWMAGGISFTLFQFVTDVTKLCVRCTVQSQCIKFGFINHLLVSNKI